MTTSPNAADLAGQTVPCPACAQTVGPLRLVHDDPAARLALILCRSCGHIFAIAGGRVRDMTRAERAALPRLAGSDWLRAEQAKVVERMIG